MTEAHVPTADVLVATYGEPDDISQDSPPNTTKVRWAHSAVLPYFQQVFTGPAARLPPLSEPWTGTDGETVVVDLIADLLHLATYVGLDAESVAFSAVGHFEAGVGRGYDYEEASCG